MIQRSAKPMQLDVCHITHDPPAAGGWNMAVDEARLVIAATVPDTPLRLRFYGWEAPTLSLGYFQRLADRGQHAASADCPVVRRASGGGAIVHDRELTYSLAVPAGHALARRAADCYALMHRTLIAALATLGVQAQELATSGRAQLREPFLCFRRAARGDVIACDARNPDRAAKVCGSAQRRRGGAVLQHGSVLLAQSDAAPELPGIAELSGTLISPTTLAASWQEQLKLLFHWELRPEAPVVAAERSAVENALAKYVAADWTCRR